jgi:hypothetical protein
MPPSPIRAQELEALIEDGAGLVLAALIEHRPAPRREGTAHR